MSDDRIISTSSDKTTKFFDLISHRTTMTLRYKKKYIYKLAHLLFDDARQENSIYNE
jgi:hypothetical protein